jgi:hypothetical protein
MSTKPPKLETIEQLLNAIYEDNYDHLDFMENMSDGDCDCVIHTLMGYIFNYQREYKK